METNNKTIHRNDNVQVTACSSKPITKLNNNKNAFQAKTFFEVENA